MQNCIRVEAKEWCKSNSIGSLGIRVVNGIILCPIPIRLQPKVSTQVRMKLGLFFLTS